MKVLKERVKRKKKLHELKKRKLRVIEMEAQLKVCKAEMEEFCARRGFMKELQALGYSNDEIKRLLADQFSQGESSSKQAYGDSSSNSSSDEEEANFSSSGVDL
jgi:Holliday junction resolvasome RuvABC DNA-binding subunit